jgi:tetratricopeptide (TPR) repeat protein
VSAAWVVDGIGYNAVLPGYSLLSVFTCVDVAELEAKLRTRADAHAAAGQRERKASAEYWRHIGALAFLRDTKKALMAYEQGVALDQDEPEGWRFLGELHYRLGDLTTAEATFESLLRLANEMGDERAEAMARLRLGWVYGDRGDLAAAEKLQSDTLRLADAASWKEGMARAYGNLGITHWTRGNLAEAEEMQRQALKLNEELGLKEGMAATYGNLGIIHQAHGNLAKAEEMHLESLGLNEELGHREGMAATYGNLGIIHEARSDLATAEKMHLKSLKLEEELGRKEGMAETYWNLAILYGRMVKKKKRMCECWRKSRDLYRDMGLADKAAEAERWLRDKGCGEG